MMLIGAGSFSASAAAVLAALLMIVCGTAKKRLHWRAVECPVCRHPRGLCTCRWL